MATWGRSDGRMSGLEQLYSPTDAASLTGLDLKTVYRMIQDGTVTAYKLRGRLRIPASSLEGWLERSRV
jgi:excisionase family DNA binding protein